MQAPARVVTFLFTDIEGSTRLWEEQPARMRPALAQHDAIARAVVEQHHGSVVKMSGDGLHAAFEDPLDAVAATLELQLALVDPERTAGIALRVRCGLHAGVDERRDNDFFGPSVNRAARIMSAAHGGQILVSQTVAALVRDRLPGGVTLRTLGQVRLRDLASSEHLFQVTHVQLRSEFPPLRSLEATPNNLPQQLTSFIGRERELDEAKSLLAKTRLLTLVGAGGIGKTRLSLQLAADAMEDFPDGIWFVELAPLAEGERVAQAIASALGVREETGRPLGEALLRHLKHRRLLIVLDNCEHLASACAESARQLLEAAPQLKLIASSREHLRTAGEHVYIVPPLSLPNDNEVASLESLTRSGAVRLFAERAAAAQPKFEVTPENVAPVLEICRRLDGIPLAIELAAARVRGLSVGAIAERLNDRFRLLASGDRAVLPRQQTLRALIDWSYDLLSEPERVVLRRLAVFAGGWTLEAAEAVIGGSDLPKGDVIHRLVQLVEKSLVVVESTGGRYRLLETIRHYAHDRLDEAGEESATRDRHLAWYLAFAETAKPELTGPQQGIWLSKLDPERENLLSAHAWCDHAQGGAEAGLKLVSAIRRYWMIRGLLELALRITAQALTRAGAEKRDFARWEALFGAGQLGSWMGRYAEARRYLLESLAIAREIGDRQMVERVLQPLGLACLGEGDHATARRHFAEALVLAEQLGDKRQLAAALNALAQLHRAQGEPETAEPLYRRVLALARELEDRESIAVALLNLAMVAIARGSADIARRMLLEVAAIIDEVGSRPLAQSLLEVSAGLAALREDWSRAARFYGAAETQAQRTGLHRDPADEAFLAPRIAKARAALGGPSFTSAEAGGRALAHEESIVETRGWLDLAF